MERLKNLLTVFGGMILGFAASGLADCGSSDRVLKITNFCKQDVWIGMAGGAGHGCPCPSGQSCNRNNGLCFWDLPDPVEGSFHLQSLQNATFCLKSSNVQNNIWLSGNIFARTGCNENGNQCQTGECGAVNGKCPPGTGGAPPVSLAEFTFVDKGSDFYDISIINGVNIPIQMKAILSGPPQNESELNPSADPYFCASPGSPYANPPLSSCSWKFNPTINGEDLSTYLRFVQPTGAPQSCTKDSNCGTGQVCGLNNALNQVCGNLIGWWTADEVCAINRNFGYPFYCDSPVEAPYNTLANLYGCTAPSISCYASGAPSNCCGCPKWPYPAANPCQNNNPDWDRQALPFAQFKKTACPTAYSFPYDDMTSTFTCSNGTPNTVNYQIIFCP